MLRIDTKDGPQQLSSEQMKAYETQAGEMQRWINQCQGSLAHWQGPHLNGQMVAIVNSDPANKDSRLILPMLEAALQAIGANAVVFNEPPATKDYSERLAETLCQDGSFWSLVVVVARPYLHFSEDLASRLGQNLKVLDISTADAQAKLQPLSIARLMALVYVLIRHWQHERSCPKSL